MKNALKILILILSVALIIGALVMVTGAEEQKDGYVSLEIGGVTFPDMTLDEALTKILTVNRTVIKDGEENVYTEVIGDKTITIENPKQINPNITLLGNVKQTIQYNNQDFDYNGDGESDGNGRTTLHIYLNGYEYDIAVSNAFNTQRGTKNVYFAGEGAIKLSSAGTSFQSNSGSCYYFHGTGRGIRIHSNQVIKDLTKYFGSGGMVEFKNCDFDIDAIIDTNVTGQMFSVSTNTSSGAYLNMYDCTIDIGIGLDLTQEDIDAGKCSATGYYVFTVANVGHVYIENTYITTDSSGLTCTGNGNANSNSCPTGKGVSFKMVNSKLVCVPDHPVTVASGKTFNKNDIAYTNLISGAGTNTGDIVFQNSYASATFRIIQGYGADKNNAYMTEEQSKVARILTFDNSTVEVERSPFDAMGMAWNKSGQGLFQFVSYANFTNNSRIVLNGTGLSSGGGSDTWTKNDSYQPGVNGTDTNSGADAHTIDLAAGTRVSSNVTSLVDLPKGYVLAQDKFSDLDCGYVVVPENYVSQYTGNSVGGARRAGFYTSGNEIGGRTGVYKWTLPVEGDTGYTLEKDQSVAFADGKVTLGNSTYITALASNFTTTPAADGVKALVYQIDVMPAPSSEKSIPIAFNFCGTNASTGKTGYYCNGLRIDADGKSNMGGIMPGVWSSITIVVDLTTEGSQNYTLYINDKQINKGSLTGFSKLTELRIETSAGAYDEGSSIAFSNYVQKTYTSAQLLKSTFDAKDYKNELSYSKIPHQNNGLASTYMVGNTPYATLNAALAATAGTNKHVTLFANNSVAEDIVNAGSVYTNGYTLTNKTTKNYTKNLIVNTLDKYVEYIATKDVTYTWNTIDGTTSVIFQQGGVPFVDDRINVTTKNKTFYNTGILYFGEEIQWTTVNPADYDNYADYAAALEGGATMPAVVDGDLVLYPVYENAAATITQKSGNNVHYVAYDQDISTRMTEVMPAYSGQWDVVLYDNVTSANYLKSADGYVRTDLRIDLNGYRFDLNLTDRWCTMASSGILRLYSSKEGGVFAHFNSSQIVNDFMMPKSNTFGTTLGGMLYLGTVDGNDAAYGDNLTVYSANLLESNGSNAQDIFINGGTYIFHGTTYGSFVAFKKAGGLLNPKNATFINACGVSSSAFADAETMFLVGGGSTVNFTNCTFIANDATERILSVRKGTESQNGTETVTFTNCKVIGTIGNTGDANDVISVDADTVAYRMIGVKTPEGYVAAYTSGVYSAETVTFRCERPVLEGGKLVATKYVYFTNDPAFTAEDAYKVVLIPGLDMKAIPADEATEYTWVDFAGETVESAFVKNGEDVLDFVTVDALDGINGTVLNVAFAGWELDGTTFKPAKKVTVATNVVYTNLSLYTNFDVNFYVPAEYYDYLDDATKALLVGTVVIEGNTYYYAEPAEMDANEAFTNATLQITLVEGGETKTLGYSTSVYKYLASTFAYEGLGAANYELAYVITEYLADAYNYFTLVDNANGAETLATLAEANVAYAPEATAIPELEDVTLGDASGAVSIYVDLKSSPKFVIKANEDGVKVSMAGAGAHTLALGEEIELSTRVFDFDNEITVTKADGATGTYNLAKYLVAICGTDAALDNLAASFYNYVMYAEAFRPAGT